MRKIYFNKTIQSLVIFVTAIIFVFTPSFTKLTLEDREMIPILTYPKAYAVADVGILQIQNLDAAYNESTGELSLDIYGIPLLNLSLVTTQQFVYKLPEELKFILDNPRFTEVARIQLTEPLFVYKEIPGSELAVSSSNGTVKASYVQGLNLSLVSRISAKLFINLGQLGLTALPPSPDGKLDFYGIAADASLITVDILVSKGAYDEIATGVLDNIPPDPPIINPVTDVDSTVSGTGETGATVHIVTPDGTYHGIVDEAGNYTVAIPIQGAGTIITASQTDVAGNTSETVSTTVIGTILEFTVPSEIRFKQTTIGFHEITIPREIPNWSIIVRDTRGQGAHWRIKAKAANPLTSTDGHSLDPTALVFVNADRLSYLKDETLIYEGVTGLERETVVTWNENEGVLINIIPSDVHPGVDYSTTINWTLENAP
ncbi:Ig-like domain-containing protein [Neobacillus sp. LXY-4]|uniref:Ig-like domain-containing protein n=1 Tax=Neobacillus sp. LXY-4 TaxID=3379826 RepID=UPI003EE23B60